MHPPAESMARGRIWSLWDMVANLSLSGVVHLMDEINIMISVAATNKEMVVQYGHEKVAGTEKSQEAVLQSKEAIDAVVRMTDMMSRVVKSSHIISAKSKLAYWATRDDPKWDDLFQRACYLRDTIKTEFRDYLYFAYQKEKGQKLQAWEADWRGIIDAFPDVRIESFSAVDCYALCHPTASVFHSMRVAEYGLRGLAKERRINLPKNKPIEWGTWQEIIKALDAEVKIIGTTWKAGPSKDSALTFYSGAVADLNGFKDEYRNLVMHVRGQYDEFQALRALTQVQAFMERISAKINHKHHRIRWGRS